MSLPLDFANAQTTRDCNGTSVDACAIRRRLRYQDLIAQPGKPTSLDDLAERYPLAGQINLSTGRAWHFPLNTDQVLNPCRINFLSTDLYSYLQAVLQGKSAGMLSDFLCEPHLKSGQLVRLFPEVEIQKWQLFLYRPYETVTPPRVLKVFEILEGILKKEFER